MNRITFAFIFLFVGLDFSSAQDLPVYNDGPYVFCTADSFVVQSIQNSKAVYRTLPFNNQSAMDVDFPDNPEWRFAVKLRTEHRNEPSVFKQPEKLFVVSDIEGEFAGFRALLIANGVIDGNYNWKFGKGHFVVCGDLFDRGLQVPECMWLLYKLEAEAEKAGGYVHVILGNHDIMNLSGDLRYVQPKYFESAKLMGLEYMSFYGPNTALGRWLRSKNVTEKIGHQLFMHAGLSPQVAGLKKSVAEINQICRLYYDTKTSLVPEPLKVLFGDGSPFWYRGYFMPPKITEAELDSTLSAFGVIRIVVGHTIVPGNVGFYYGGKVLGLDVDRHHGDHQAAVFEKGVWHKVNEKGETKML